MARWLALCGLLFPSGMSNRIFSGLLHLRWSGVRQTKQTLFWVFILSTCVLRMFVYRLLFLCPGLPQWISESRIN
ncbi:hypothetical protein LI328DRAFT_101502 [Trichoderma asperelloides]|nr:hypothetical protein LI328DRAFT_101502 [Trichoderma asperelloides]